MAKNKKERERVATLEPVYKILALKVPHQSAHLGKSRKTKPTEEETILETIKLIDRFVWLIPLTRP